MLTPVIGLLHPALNRKGFPSISGGYLKIPLPASSRFEDRVLANDESGLMWEKNLKRFMRLAAPIRSLTSPCHCR